MLNAKEFIQQTRQDNILVCRGTDDVYRSLLVDIPEIAIEYTPLIAFEFPYPVFSARLRYAKRIIDNSIHEELNALINEASGEGCSGIPSFMMIKIMRSLKSALKQLQGIIDDRCYDVEKLSSKGTRFSDSEYFENTYICHYLSQSLIYLAIEYQEQFSAYIPKDKQVSLESIYLDILKMMPPESAHISRSDRKINDNSIDDNIDIEKMPTAAQIFYNEVQKYEFFSLPKLSVLNLPKKKLLITKMTGQPLPYIVAMLDYLGYNRYLKDNYNMNKEKIYEHLSIALNNVSVRQIKGNFNVLNPDSKDDTQRYTSHQYTEIVKNDFKSL